MLKFSPKKKLKIFQMIFWLKGQEESFWNILWTIPPFFLPPAPLQNKNFKFL
jgi:hypothetical protein